MLYCATSNPGKLREFQMAGIGVQPVPGLEALAASPEDGDTFEANAAQKAIYYSWFAPGPVLVDDSGLEVGALGGQPGIYSARFAGPDASAEQNNHKLLAALEGALDRHARFVTVVTVAHAGAVLASFRGECRGEIARARRGEGGFGYDPLFLYPPLGRTFGELTDEEKLRVSARGQALSQLAEFVRAGRLGMP